MYLAEKLPNLQSFLVEDYNFCMLTLQEHDDSYDSFTIFSIDDSFIVKCFIDINKIDNKFLKVHFLNYGQKNVKDNMDKTGLNKGKMWYFW